VGNAGNGEQVNYDDYAEQVKKLLDKHVTGVEVREPDGGMKSVKWARAKARRVGQQENPQ
jgi:hypothetical protein